MEGKGGTKGRKEGGRKEGGREEGWREDGERKGRKEGGMKTEKRGREGGGWEQRMGRRKYMQRREREAWTLYACIPYSGYFSGGGGGGGGGGGVKFSWFLWLRGEP